MKSRFTKVIGLLLAVSMVFSMIAVSSVMSSADGYGSDVLLNFSGDKAGEGSAIGSLSYDNGSLNLKSNGIAQDYSKGEYITQTFSIDASGDKAFAAVMADRATKRIATDVTLPECICHAVTATTEWDVKSVEVQLMLYGKRGDTPCVTKSSVYLKEGENGRVILDIPPETTSIDTLVIKFENNISNMTSLKGKKAGPKDITATFSPLKVYTVDDGVASTDGQAGCVYDWSQTDQYSMLGSGPLVQNAKVKFNHDAKIFNPVGAMQIVTDPSLKKWHSEETGQEWMWEDTGIKLYPSKGVFADYDGMSMYVYVVADEAFYKWDYPDWSSAPLSISASATVPARDEDGNFVNEDWDIVETAEEAYEDLAYFKIKSDIQVQGELTTVTAKDKIVAGEVYTLNVKFNQFSQTQPWPEIDMWPYDYLSDESPYGGKVADYLKSLSIGRATMANDCYVNYFLSDIYGIQGNNSLLPEIDGPNPPAPTTTTTTTTTEPTTTTTTTTEPTTTTTTTTTTAPTTTTTTTVAPSTRKGDVNCDGVVNILDLRELMSRFADASTDKMADQAKKNADVNEDGILNAIDLRMIYLLTVVD